MPEFRRVYQSRALFHSSYLSSAFYHDPEMRREVSEHTEQARVKREVWRELGPVLLTDILINWLSKKMELSYYFFQLWFKRGKLSTYLPCYQKRILHSSLLVCTGGTWFMNSLQRWGSVWVLPLCCRGSLHSGILIFLWSTSLLVELGVMYLAQILWITLLIPGA